LKKNLATEPGTQAVERALAILYSFRAEKTRWKLAELSVHLGLPKSSVHRILCALRNNGFVETDEETGQYRLGLRICELTEAVERKQLLSKVAHPYLVALSEETGEICHLAIKTGREFMYFDRVEGKYRFGLRTYVGMSLPLHIGGLGKVLLGYCDKKEIGNFIRREMFKKFTGNTITESKRLKGILAEVRERGYAIDDEEYEEGLMCVGVPLFDRTNQAIAALSLSGPKERLARQNMPRYITKTIDAGRNISRALGYEGEYPRKE
jgi:IclR family transcriptional regulator, KDG regulon repressor